MGKLIQIKGGGWVDPDAVRAIQVIWQLRGEDTIPSVAILGLGGKFVVDDSYQTCEAAEQVRDELAAVINAARIES